MVGHYSPEQDTEFSEGCGGGSVGGGGGVGGSEAPMTALEQGRGRSERSAIVPIRPVPTVVGSALLALMTLSLTALLTGEPRLLGIALVIAVAANLGLAASAVVRGRTIRRMREAEGSFRDLHEHISEGVFRSTLDGRMISANPSLVRFNGYETEQELLEAVRDIATEWYVDPGRRAEIHQVLLEKGQVTNLVSEVYRHRTRERIWMEESTRLVRDDRTGEPLYYEGTLRDVTETMRRLELQDRYDKIASIMSGCLYQFRMHPDGSTSVPYASSGLLHMFGIAPETVIEDAAPLYAIIHPDDRPGVVTSIEESRDSLAPWQTEFRIRRPDGEERWVLGHSVPEREGSGATLWHGYLTDVTERKRSEARIHDLAFFDPLTKLPNRTLLRSRLEQAMSGARALHGALLFIDLDQFKMLNDTKGHHVGDLLLCEVAERLRGSIRRTDLVARLGGDEFVVLLEALDESHDAAVVQARAVADNALATIGEPYQLGESIFRTSASIGCALFGPQDRIADEILKRADLAMYEAKAAGRGNVCFFAPAMQEKVADSLALSSDLRLALSAGGLELHFQPQVDRSGACFGAEALLRWPHADRGLIAPSDIVSLAERNALLNPLEEWVLLHACDTLRSWQHDHLTRNLQLAVNISAHQLNRKEFVATVKDALRRTGANPARLCLELTEHVMLDSIQGVSATMLNLKELGLTLALDDFGTGYSSLAYLKRLPIDALKIDRSFVRDLEDDPSDRAITQMVINIARILDVSVIAEGVENEVQVMLLRQLGCQAFQGYLYGRPMPHDAFLSHLGSWQDSANPLSGRPRRTGGCTSAGVP